MLDTIPRSHPDGRHPIDPIEVVRRLVDARLAQFFDDRRDDVPEAPEAIETLARTIQTLHDAGGKRLRPAFVVWGHVAAGGALDGGAIDAAAATELLHDFALLHDDGMDGSASRRGMPAAHVALRSHHPGSPEHDGAAWFGVSAAVLAGDLAFVWADRLLDALDHAELPGASIRRARELFSQMRTEVIAGQYLDLRVGGSDTATEHDGSQIALLKSARYTVTRPLQIGAVLAQADDEMCARLAAYGDAVGTAFQLRDDVLGLFGDPVQTGKSCVDDLREGKRNVLVLRALRLATEAERAVLHATLGAPHVDDVVADRCREVVSGSGALASVEATISELLEQALAVATTFDPAATPALEHLAWYAARRDR